jgi:hypothetical protein
MNLNRELKGTLKPGVKISSKEGEEKEHPS